MKIDELSRQSVNSLPRDEKPEKAAGAETDTAAKSGKKGDKVALSSGLEKVKAAKEMISSQPEFRVDRVEELKTRLAAGTYKVSSVDVAGKMLASMARGTKH